MSLVLPAAATAAFVAAMYVYPDERRLTTYQRDAPRNVRRRMLSMVVITVAAALYLWHRSSSVGFRSASSLLSSAIWRALKLTVSLFLGVFAEHAIALSSHLRSCFIHELSISAEQQRQKRIDVTQATRGDDRNHWLDTTLTSASRSVMTWVLNVSSRKAPTAVHQALATLPEAVLLLQYGVTVRQFVGCAWQVFRSQIRWSASRFVDASTDTDAEEEEGAANPAARSTAMSPTKRWLSTPILLSLRDYVVAPFCEEVYFRAFTISLIWDHLGDGTTAVVPPAFWWSVLWRNAVIFSGAHLHHGALHYARRATFAANRLGPAEERPPQWCVWSPQYRDALVTALRLASSQAFVTFLFGLFGSYLYLACDTSVVAVAIAHGLCNAIGAPKLQFLSRCRSPAQRLFILAAYIAGVASFVRQVVVIHVS